MIRSTAKKSTGTKFGYMSLSSKYITAGDWESGNYAKMKASSFDVVSEENVKTNIASTESVLDLFSAESSQIYSYNLKKTVITETEEGSDGDVSTDGDGVIIEEQVEETTSYGFVIGDGYAVPEQVLNKDGNAINLYSMAALTWKAVQELYLKIKALEETING
jgi:phage repressor protein C with HTH and peptisase S24 domain